MSDETWGLYVHCKRGGVSRDSGLHATYPTKCAAEAAASGEVEWLRRVGWYDEVSYTIRPVK